jgi:hypothetical protein
VEKKERQPVSGRHSDQFAGGFCCPKRFSAADDLIEFLEKLNLLVNQQFRKTHYVD